jgi:hypothetical protein
MAIAARSRPDLDIEDGISTYEFSTISRALFAPDGALLPCTDKSNLAKCLEELPGKRDETDATPIGLEAAQALPNPSKVVIIDAMVIVQQIASKQGNVVKSCADLAKQYIISLEEKICDYDTIHVVFDHYDTGISLKQATQERRKGNVKAERSYVCVDSTPIKTSLSTFLQSSKTKDSLTRYLGDKVLQHFHGGGKVVARRSSTGLLPINMSIF